MQNCFIVSALQHGRHENPLCRNGKSHANKRKLTVSQSKIFKMRTTAGELNKGFYQVKVAKGDTKQPWGVRKSRLDANYQMCLTSDGDHYQLIKSTVKIIRNSVFLWKLLWNLVEVAILRTTQVEHSY